MHNAQPPLYLIYYSLSRDLMTKEDFRKLGYKEPDEINLR